MKPTFFTPGPSELYFTVPDHLRTALKEGIPSIYHRSQQFKNLFRDCTTHLRELLSIPKDYSLVFTSSATEVWERIALNLIEREASFVCNGAFSSRFADTVEHWGRIAHRVQIKDGDGLQNVNEIGAAKELVGIAFNETSTGVMTPQNTLEAIRNKYPDALLAVDVVSAVPAMKFDFSLVDTAYFSVQKGFGLPAGLGVWIVNERCLEKARTLESQGVHTGSYHRLLHMVEMAKKNQTPSTPNVMAIYLLNKVVMDMQTKGLEMIRREIRYKAAVLYQSMEDHPDMEPFVEHKDYRSQTTLVAKVKDSGRWMEVLLEKHLLVGRGYGPHKETHLRIANFPTHSKEQIELLADEIVKVRMNS